MGYPCCNLRNKLTSGRSMAKSSSVAIWVANKSFAPGLSKWHAIMFILISLFIVNPSLSEAEDSIGAKEAGKRIDQDTRDVNKLVDEGKFKEAIPLAKRILEYEEKTLGRKNATTLRMQELIAIYHMNAGEYKE